MKDYAPHIIKEGDLEFRLGSLEGSRVSYDFDKIWQYLLVKGKLMFGERFHLYEVDREVIYKLCLYMIQDAESCKKVGLDVNKGILLTGPVGCGKTSLMRLVKHIVPHVRSYEVIPTRNIVFAFNHIGYDTIQQFGDSKFFCLDDLGVEPTGRYFGKDCNVIGEVLLSRYDLFLSHQVRTHATTNLNAKELEAHYGNRVRSRMRQLFNLVAFDKKSRDKRR